MLFILALSRGRGLGEGKKKETNLTPLIPTFSRWRRSLEPKVNSVGLRLSIFISN